MREQESQFKPGRDPEATVIRPLFDEDAAEVARPVIPLDDRAMDEGMGAYVETGTAPPAYTRAWKRRNYPTIMLVLAALFAGAVVGITGLYFYQRSSRISDAAVKTTGPEQQQQAPATSEVPPAAAPSAAKTTEDAQPSVDAEPAASAAGEVAAGADAAERDRVKVNDGAGTTREAERAAPARRPEADEEEARPSADKRGKKGDDDDDETADEPTRSRPRVYDTQGPAPAGSAAERRAAREEERLRRMRRERRRRGEAYMVDSIRGIFEGGRDSPPR